MKNEIKTCFAINGVEIKADANGHFSLTKIWQASKSGDAKKPAQYLRNDSAIEFIESRAKILEVQICTLTRTAHGGKYAGVWADIHIALAYAQWIDPVFHQIVNEAYISWYEEAKDGELKIARGVEVLQKRGVPDDVIAERLAAILTRKSFTDILDEHGCEVTENVWKSPYFIATNLIHEAATGVSTAQGIRARRGLAKVVYLEAEAGYEIRERNAQGNDECIQAVRDVVARNPYAAPQRQLAAG